MNDPDWMAPIRVRRHAYERLKERCRLTLTYRQVRGEIRTAILEGRWSHREPDWVADYTRSYPRTRRESVYVWDVWEERAWVAIPHDDGSITVVTVLARKSSTADDDHRVRTGMARVA